MYIDFHSHILPKIDDGSQSVEESVQMLEMLANQGVATVIATPHFDPNRESVDDFIDRRGVAYLALCESDGASLPGIEIKLGAEVTYYPGISRMEGLEKLCIEGTGFLLLEMPMSKWSKYTLDEIVNMPSTRGIVVIIAHVERCMSYQDEKTLETLYESEILLQINASYLLRPMTKRKAIKMLSRGQIHVIGSDCHNIKTRPPKIDSAYKVIADKLGDDFVRGFTDFNESLIS